MLVVANPNKAKQKRRPIGLRSCFSSSSRTRTYDPYVCGTGLDGNPLEPTTHTFAVPEKMIGRRCAPPFFRPRHQHFAPFFCRRQRSLMLQITAAMRLPKHNVVGSTRCVKWQNKRPPEWVVFVLAPQVGLEPTTLRLTAACSTD